MPSPLFCGKLWRKANVEILKGFEAAKARLSRQVTMDLGKVTPRTQQRLKEIFGRDITASEAVAQILGDIKKNGDAAVRDYTFRIDGFKTDILEVSREEIQTAYSHVSRDLVEALKVAAERIRKFHQEQKDYLFHGVIGEEWGQLVRPLARSGLYTPASTAVYPSTVLMTAIPAKVAGVKEVIHCTPPRNNGSVPPATLVAADLAGVDRVFRIGGAQAIAAMAYGTRSVPKVDKICGPGNLFVALAKQAVFGVVDIDALQGPSEVLIIADKTARPHFCAADLLAQAEHDQLPQVILVTTSPHLAQDVQRELALQLAALPRQQTASEALESRAIIAIVDSLDQAIQLSNLYAPEHLELMIERAESYIDQIINAGCIFVGELATVPMGDYIAGPNHSLPTGGTARFSSPLNVADFIKFIDVVKVNQSLIDKLGPSAITIARAEGLEAHARAIELRLKN
jgi:histidinol dehydrogenase